MTLTRTQSLLTVASQCLILAMGTAESSVADPVVGHAVFGGETGSLREIEQVQAALATEGSKPVRQIPLRRFRRDPNTNAPQAQRDPVIQSYAPALQMPGPTLTFDGLSNLDGVAPPDTNGDVGSSNYVQIVNAHFRVFNKFTGAAQTRPLLI